MPAVLPHNRCPTRFPFPGALEASSHCSQSFPPPRVPGSFQGRGVGRNCRAGSGSAALVPSLGTRRQGSFGRALCQCWDCNDSFGFSNLQTLPSGCQPPSTSYGFAYERENYGALEGGREGGVTCWDGHFLPGDGGGGGRQCGSRVGCNPLGMEIGSLPWIFDLFPVDLIYFLHGRHCPAWLSVSAGSAGCSVCKENP